MRPLSELIWWPTYINKKHKLAEQIFLHLVARQILRQGIEQSVFQSKVFPLNYTEWQSKNTVEVLVKPSFKQSEWVTEWS